ncbi:MAG: hypothetical protein AAGA92_08445 [Planctomycetota bacterium]
MRHSAERLKPLMAGWLLLGAVLPSAAAAASVEAFLSEPFGVGMVTVPVTAAGPALPLSDERFLAQAEGGRVLYSVVKEAPVRKVVRRLLKLESPRSVTLYFLFRGDEPFDLEVYSPSLQVIRVKPIADSSGLARLQQGWWSEQVRRWQRLLSEGDFPPVAENFLVANLAYRLGKELPVEAKSILPWKKSKKTVWQELFATEQHALRVDRELLSATSETDTQFVDLPEPIRFDPRDQTLPDNLPAEEAVGELMPPEGQGGVEKIASYVPDDCFYIRFGTASNYFWFRDFSKKWGGDLSSMVLRRPLDRNASDRIQQQLSLRESVFAKLLGPQVIRDVAMIGEDPYAAHGMGIGLLFEAKNTVLLGKDLIDKRQESVTNPELQATEEQIQIGERTASLVSTPDGRVRSYYARVGDFHLVATSQSLIEGFFRCADGDGALADSEELSDARRALASGETPAVSVFVPSKFFEKLVSPAFRIEAERRLRASRQKALLTLASHAAAHEGVAVGDGRFDPQALLPQGFGDRPDGSEWATDTNGGLIDSLRGKQGCFIPVADITIDRITAAEAADYESFRQSFADEVGRMPSIALEITRMQHDGYETATARAHVAPMAGCKPLASLADQLAAANDQQIAAVPGDIAAFEAAVDIDSKLWNPDQQPHTLFGGLRDFQSLLTVRSGGLAPAAGRAELVRGYLGAWPRPGVLGLFINTNQGTEPVPARGDDLWQAIQDDVFLLSFKREVVEEVMPHLALEPADRPAQVRLRIDDLTGTQVSETARAIGYSRTRQASVAASRLMNSISNQFGLDRATGRDLAETIMDGVFQCPLNGEYQLVESPRELPMWTSTALGPENRFLLSGIPGDFELPLLSWFRGVRGELLVEQGSLRARFEIDISESALPD